MSNQENERVILRWFDALNKADIPRLDQMASECFSPDFVGHDPRMAEFEHGPTGVKNFIHQLLKENTAVQVTIHDIFSNEDRIAYRFSVSMTDIASGRMVDVMLLAIDRFVDGQIAEEWQLSAPGNW
ncbi:MAG: nuclear transport factor 2 family protein [Chloroflexi bacterium]|nr:MAG: nuclear transport factor 2 family protein [Chloroflexota bacterium]